jgi:hypothetical protein
MAVEMNSFLSPPETFVFNINIFISAVQHWHGHSQQSCN